MKRTFAALAVLALAALPAAADIYYKASTWQEGDNVNEAVNMTVEAWVNEGEADIRFVSSGNPFMRQGTRLVAKNEAREIYLVDDEQQTVSPWELDKILGMTSAIMQSMGPLMKFKIENPRVEMLLEEPGGQIAGRDTTHYRYLTEYDLIFKVLGMGQRQHVRSVQDIWSTTDLDDVALGVWLKWDPPDFGDSGFKELIELEQSKVKGFPLRTVVEEMSEGKKGKNQATTRTITEVSELDERSAPAGTYTWPATYSTVNTMPTDEQLAAGQQEQPAEGEGEEEPKKGWRSKVPFGKKKGG